MNDKPIIKTVYNCISYVVCLTTKNSLNVKAKKQTVAKINADANGCEELHITDFKIIS